MKKLLTVFILGTFFISCATDHSNTTNTSVIGKITNITLPFKSVQYSEYPSQLISSQQELDTFLKQVANIEQRSGKIDFLEILQNTKIDFKKDNLLFYRITEGSGSIKLVVKDSNTVIKNNQAIITIESNHPKYHTDDMTYYALAYKVSKSIKSIIFKNAQQRVIIKNKKSNMIIPENCQAWFDGCNNYFRGKTKNVMYTQRECYVQQPQNFKCTKWSR